MSGYANLFSHPFVSLHQDRGRTFGKRVRMDHDNMTYPTNQRVIHHNRMGPYRPLNRPYSTHNFPLVKG